METRLTISVALKMVVVRDRETDRKEKQKKRQIKGRRETVKRETEGRQDNTKYTAIMSSLGTGDAKITDNTTSKNTTRVLPLF